MKKEQLKVLNEKLKQLDELKVCQESEFEKEIKKRETEIEKITTE